MASYQAMLLPTSCLDGPLPLDKGEASSRI